jgi:hypothetical protein
VPNWARFLIGFGYTWSIFEGVRRIVLLSMPCDSAAAGLVALGAMRQILELEGANDMSAHFQRIEAAAKGRGAQVFLRHTKWKGRFVVDAVDRNRMVWVRKEHSKTADRMTLTPKDANDWRVESEGPVQAVTGGPLPFAALYTALVADSGAPLMENLQLSDSRICLAGRTAGEKQSGQILQTIRFQLDAQQADLAHMLTIHAWSPATVSRVTFYNSRTRELDRLTGRPKLVVVDGDQAFLRVVDAEEFRDADVLAVMHRVIERDRLEAVGNKMINLRQWYSPDTELGTIAPTPNGISISVLRRT